MSHISSLFLTQKGKIIEIKDTVVSKNLIKLAQWDKQVLTDKDRPVIAGGKKLIDVHILAAQTLLGKIS